MGELLSVIRREDSFRGNGRLDQTETALDSMEAVEEAANQGQEADGAGDRQGEGIYLSL